MKKYLPILLLLTMILSGCRLETQELPPPTELFAAIQAKVELPKMVNTAETDLEALIGIESDTYDSAVCYRLYEGTAPDEIIIVHARDNEMSREIQLLLEKRLGYKRESGELYLTEYQPMLWWTAGPTLPRKSALCSGRPTAATSRFFRRRYPIPSAPRRPAPRARAFLHMTPAAKWPKPMEI